MGQRRRAFAAVVGLAALVGTFVATPTATVGAQEPAFPARDTYAAAGPYAVTEEAASTSYTIYRPTTLSTTDPHPILTWANGVSANCDVGAPTMQHLASWGYVVICDNDWLNGRGNGDQALAAARYMVAENVSPGSPYYQRLDPAKVGAVGSSQGACGAVWATLKSNGLIRSTLSHAYVDPFFETLACPTPKPNWSSLTAPVLFVRGTSDFLANSGPTNTRYDAVGVAPAAKAALVGGCHCMEVPYSAYMTAWFEYTLEGDPLARGAFVSVDGQTPELARDPAFSEFGGKRLP